MATLEQLQAIETAAMHISDFLIATNKSGKANLVAAKKVGAELRGAVLAAGGKNEWAQEILDTIHKAEGYQYSREVLNGLRGYKIKGYANQLDAAEREAGQVSLVSIVGRGVPIDADGTNASHDGARKEAARILETYLTYVYTAGDNKGKTIMQAHAKEWGLKDGETLEIIDGKGKLNRRNLDKALRVFQTDKGLDADGRIGAVTADYLLYEKDNKYDSRYYGAKSHAGVFGEKGAYLCGKTLTCDLQTYVDGTDKDKDADALKQRSRDAIVEVRSVIERFQGKDIPDSKKLTDAEKAALKTLSEGVKQDENLTKEEIKAFQTAFGLAADGVVGRKTLAAINQIGLRLATGDVIDPSEIRAAVQTQTGGHRPKGKQQG